MKFKIDENLPVEVAQQLRSAGYDAMTVLEQQMGGEPDQNLYHSMFKFSVRGYSSHHGIRVSALG